MVREARYRVKKFDVKTNPRIIALRRQGTLNPSVEAYDKWVTIDEPDVDFFMSLCDKYKLPSAMRNVAFTFMKLLRKIQQTYPREIWKPEFLYRWRNYISFQASNKEISLPDKFAKLSIAMIERYCTDIMVFTVPAWESRDDKTYYFWGELIGYIVGRVPSTFPMVFPITFA